MLSTWAVSLGAMKLLTYLSKAHGLSRVLTQSYSPLRFHQNPISVTQNNCKLKTENDCINKYNKLISMEWNPSLAYLYVLLIYTDIPRVLMIDTPRESTPVWHHCVCHLRSKHPPTPSKVWCDAQPNSATFCTQSGYLLPWQLCAWEPLTNPLS